MKRGQVYKRQLLADAVGLPQMIAMKNLAESIRERCQRLPEGSLFTNEEFLSVGSRVAVNRAFSYLAQHQRLIRISRGLYTSPIVGRFGVRAPAIEKVIRALASRTHSTIVASGARTANAMGLTHQVPVQEVFLTSGHPQVLRLGNLVVYIEPAPSWQLALGATPAGDAIRALAWLGQPCVSEATVKLRQRLPDSEWQRLIAVRSLLPEWMARAIDGAIASS
nr:DUF6088 family protein [uncultured Pseudomonas sp.]